MARLSLSVMLVASILFCVGCNGVDAGKGQQIPVEVKKQEVIEPSYSLENTRETDLVEQVAVNRKAYRNSLEMLKNYYKKTGNNLKLDWVKKEISAFETMTQYDYIVEAGIAGPELQPKNSIAAADELYFDAIELEDRAGTLVLVKNEELLRQALNKYNQLIRQYPTSDKIDDAAYRAAGIYDYFKDYSIAVVYYKRSFQWNPEMPRPARFKAAYILDRKLRRKDEALSLYKEALDKDTLNESQEEFIEMRIPELEGEEKEIE